MERYSINQLALITGLTSRTIRNHINLGLLKGEKADGSWSFSEEDIDAYMSNDYVRQSVLAKRNALVYDFMADTSRKGGRSCVMLHVPAGAAEARKISDIFCGAINSGAADVRFSFAYEKGEARIILTGAEEQVERIMDEYRGSRAER